MQDTSSLYKSIMAGIHRFEVKLDIAGTEYGMSELVALKTNVAAFSDDGPQLGLAVAQEISVDVYADSADIPRMAELKPYYRVINDRSQSEWIQKGVFYLDTRERSSSGVMHLTGFDNMLKAEVVYPGSSLSWPATDIDVVREIAGFMNVTIDARTTAIITSGYEVQLAPQMTMREMLQYIAAMYGGSFIFSDTGELLLVCVWDLDDSDPYTITKRGTSQSTRPAFPPCTGVRFIVSQSATEQTEVFSGDETGYVYEIECPFATQEIADSLLNKMRGMVYRPYSAEKVAADPALEIGDTVSLGTRIVTDSGNLIPYPLYSSSSQSLLFNIELNYGIDGSIAITGSVPAENSEFAYSITTNDLTLRTPSKKITVIVEAPTDFPSTNGGGHPNFAAVVKTSSGTTASYQLSLTTTKNAKKYFYATISRSENIESLHINFIFGGVEARTYNGTIKIMVNPGSDLVPWQPPVGATAEQFSGIYSFDLAFNSACRPTFAAPGELEIDHEYTMDRVSSRSFKRMKREVYSEIKLLDDEIDLTVKKGEVCAQISLEPDDITISGNRIQITSTNWSITKDGVMTAKSGQIGGWTIDSNNLSWSDINNRKAVLSGTDGSLSVSLGELSGVDVGTFRNTVQQRIYAGLRFYGYDAQTITKTEAARILAGNTNFGNLYTAVAIPSNGRIIIYSNLDYSLGSTDDVVLEIMPSSTDRLVEVYGGCYIRGSLFVGGDLGVSGEKNRIVRTKNYGQRNMAAYETAAPYFGDIGQGTTEKNGECIVPIEAIFSETVDLDTEYQVFLQKEGPGDIWVQEKARDHFTVKGTPGLKFAWELKAKQIDHGGKRLEEYKPKEEPEAHE